MPNYKPFSPFRGTMTNQFYFPRLQRDAARALLAEYSTMQINAVANLAALESDKSYWYPTAPSGLRATTEMIENFQTTVREIAKRHGYPTVLGLKDRARGRFDRDIVTEILSLAPLLPSEAAQESVWSFLSLVVAPDVALWRWPNSKEKDDYVRILGYPRNVFRRLWWRAFTLGVGPGSVSEKMLEDEAVAILERTSIGGNRVLVRTIAAAQIRRFEDAPKRTDLMRDVMKRIRRLHAFISFHSLSEGEISAVVEGVFDEAQASLLGTTWREQTRRGRG
jgi:Family of unknown function (DUF6339)